MIQLTEEFRDCQSKITKLTKYDFSFSDQNKLKQFEDSFRSLASEFSYRSAKPEDIEINRNTLIPYLKGLELREISSTAADIKADSSASDFCSVNLVVFNFCL